MTFSTIYPLLPPIPNPERSSHDFTINYQNLGNFSQPLAWLESRLPQHNNNFQEYLHNIFLNCNPYIYYSDLLTSLDPLLNYNYNYVPEDIIEKIAINNVVPQVEEIFITHFNSHTSQTDYDSIFTDELIDNSLCVAGIYGDGVTLASIALLSFLWNIEPDKALGHPRANSQGVIDDSRWIDQLHIIQKIHRFLRHTKKHSTFDTSTILVFSLWPEMINLTAHYIYAASKSHPIIVSDCVNLLAASLAEELCPGVRNWCLVATSNPYPIYQLASQKLFLEIQLPLEFNLPSPQTAIVFCRILDQVLQFSQLSPE